MKFMGAVGLASAREKRFGTFDAAEGGNGCCEYTRVVTGGRETYGCACTEKAGFEDGGAGAGGVAGNIGRLGCKVVACNRRETKCG